MSLGATVFPHTRIHTPQGPCLAEAIERLQAANFGMQAVLQRRALTSASLCHQRARRETLVVAAAPMPRGQQQQQQVQGVSSTSLALDKVPNFRDLASACGPEGKQVLPGAWLLAGMTPGMTPQRDWLQQYRVLFQ